MYLTTIPFDSQDKYAQHQEVTRLFPKGSGRVLFTARNSGTLQVLSSVKVEGLDCEEVKGYKEGDVVPFKILFNPTKSVRLEKGGNKSRCTGILDTEEAAKWLTKQLEEKAGVKVVGVACVFQGTKKILKGGGVHAIVVQHMGVGMLTVEDPSKFRVAMANGFGKAKFAGYGMLDLWYATQG